MIEFVTADNHGDLYLKLQREPSFWMPIMEGVDDWGHLSFMYISSMDRQWEYIVGGNHVDVDTLDFGLILKLMGFPDVDTPTLPSRYIYNLKYVNLYANHNYGVYEPGVLAWVNTNKPIDLHSDMAKVQHIYQSWYPKEENINTVIPIMRWVEWCRDYRDKFIDSINGLDYSVVPLYMKYYEVISYIESCNIYLDGERRRRSSIHFFTATGRSSSKCGDINLNSLPKHGDERAKIITRFPSGKLIEYDYDSYHLRLISNVLGIPLPSGDVHNYFASVYFKSREVTPEQYKRGKEITFTQLYNRVADEYKDIEFFKAISEFKSKFFKKCVDDGGFTAPFSKRFVKLDWISDYTESKIFNYFIQILEVERNIEIIWKIYYYLYTKRSVFIFYNHDSFLIDNSPDEPGVIKGLYDIISNDDYPCKIKVGQNYRDMIPISLE